MYKIYPLVGKLAGIDLKLVSVVKWPGNPCIQRARSTEHEQNMLPLLLVLDRTTKTADLTPPGKRARVSNNRLDSTFLPRVRLAKLAQTGTSFDT